MLLLQGGGIGIAIGANINKHPVVDGGEQALILSLPTGAELYMNDTAEAVTFEIDALNGAKLEGLSGEVKDINGNVNDNFDITFDVASNDSIKINGHVGIKQGTAVAPGNYTLNVINNDIVAATQSLVVSSAPNSSISLTDHQYTLEEVGQEFTLSAIVGAWTGKDNAPITWELSAGANNYVTTSPSADGTKNTVTVTTLPVGADVTITLRAQVSPQVYDTCSITIAQQVVVDQNVITITGGLNQLNNVGDSTTLTVDVQNWDGRPVNVIASEALENYLSIDRDLKNEKRWIVTYVAAIPTGKSFKGEVIAYIGDMPNLSVDDAHDNYEITISNNPVRASLSAQVENNGPVESSPTYSFTTLSETKLLRATTVDIDSENLVWTLEGDAGTYLDFDVDSNDRTACTITYDVPPPSPIQAAIKVQDTVTRLAYILNVSIYPPTAQNLSLTSTSPILNSTDGLIGGTLSTTISQIFSKPFDPSVLEATVWSIVQGEGTPAVVDLQVDDDDLIGTNAIVTLNNSYASQTTNTYVKIHAENASEGVGADVIITILAKSDTPIADNTPTGEIISNSGKTLATIGQELDLTVNTNLTYDAVDWNINGQAGYEEYISLTQQGGINQAKAKYEGDGVTSIKSVLAVAVCKYQTNTVGYFTFQIDIYPPATVRILTLTTGSVTDNPTIDNPRPWASEAINSITTLGASFDIRADLNIDDMANNSVFWALEWADEDHPAELVTNYFDLSTGPGPQRWYASLQYKKRVLEPAAVNIVATYGDTYGGPNAELTSKYRINLIPTTGEPKLQVSGLTSRNTLSVTENFTVANLSMLVGGEVMTENVAWTCTSAQSPVTFTNNTGNGGARLSIAPTTEKFAGGIYTITGKYSSYQVSTTIMIESVDINAWKGVVNEKVKLTVNGAKSGYYFRPKGLQTSSNPSFANVNSLIIDFSWMAYQQDNPTPANVRYIAGRIYLYKRLGASGTTNDRIWNSTCIIDVSSSADITSLDAFAASLTGLNATGGYYDNNATSFYFRLFSGIAPSYIENPWIVELNVQYKISD